LPKADAFQANLDKTFSDLKPNAHGQRVAYRREGAWPFDRQMVRSARSAAATDELAPPHPPLGSSIIAGAIIGFVVGVTGIGGGIFIAPLVLTLHWLNTRHAAGLSALFNPLNSAAALAGLWSTSLVLPSELPSWLGAVAVGAILGSWLGAKHLPSGILRYILSALLLVGGVWMLLS
jgi:uncharacterized membrane protein YfcA